MKGFRYYVFDAAAVIFGGIIYSFAINMFCVPNGIVLGGATGLATVFKILFGVPMGFFSVALNAFLICISLKKISVKTLLRTGAAICVTALLLDVTAALPFFPEYTENPLLACVFGGVLAGIGLGLIYMRGISTGGSDLLALLLEKSMPYISYGKLIVVIDTFVILLAGIVFKNITLMLYALIGVYIMGEIVDKLVSGPYTAKLVYIITENPKAVKLAVIKNLQRGVTCISVRGGYSNTEKTLLLTAVRRVQLFRLKDIVKQTDKNAFVIIGDATEVNGLGFKKDE